MTVEISGPPHFLCIGAQKAATTWLYHNLRRHPEIWLPPYKELHRFDLRDGTTTFRLWRRRPTKFWQEIRGILLTALKSGDVATVVWLIRFFFGRRSPQWYRRLFPRSGARLCGDITPAYATLSAEAVRRVHRLLPDARIIFIMRDPIERAWSQINMKSWLIYNCAGTELPDNVLNRLLQGDFVALRSNYVRTLSNWEACYEPQQFLIDFYESICEDPSGFMDRVLQFLGVAPLVDQAALDSRQHVYQKPDIPPRAARWLAQQYRPMILDLVDRFDNPIVRRWLATADAILEVEKP